MITNTMAILIFLMGLFLGALVVIGVLIVGFDHWFTPTPEEVEEIIEWYDAEYGTSNERE